MYFLIQVALPRTQSDYTGSRRQFSTPPHQLSELGYMHFVHPVLYNILLFKGKVEYHVVKGLYSVSLWYTHSATYSQHRDEGYHRPF